MTVNYLEKPTNNLLDNFGAGDASPGSGSAAALMGLLAAKLTITVCIKSIQYEKDDKKRQRFEFIKKQIELSIVPQLKALFEKDARDFKRVVELWREVEAEVSPPKKAAITRESNDLLELATDYVFEIMDLSMSLIDHSVFVFESGWPTVRGDSGAAVSAAMAGVTSGIFVTNLNLKKLKDRKYAKKNISRCDDYYNKLQKKQEKAFSCVVSLNTEVLDAIQLELEVTNNKRNQ